MISLFTTHTVYLFLRGFPPFSWPRFSPLLDTRSTNNFTHEYVADVDTPQIFKPAGDIHSPTILGASITATIPPQDETFQLCSPEVTIRMPQRQVVTSMISLNKSVHNLEGQILTR